jgi:hypothetical protein
MTSPVTCVASGSPHVFRVSAYNVMQAMAEFQHDSMHLAFLLGMHAAVLAAHVRSSASTCSDDQDRYQQ